MMAYGEMKVYLYKHGKAVPLPIEYEAGWAPEPVWTLWRRESSHTTSQELNQSVVIIQPIA
jgi:hypothetical protein